MNYAKPVARYARNLLNKSRHRPSMLNTSIMLTYHCPQHCRQCNVHEVHTKNAFMPVEDFERIVHILGKQGTQGLTFSGGEPMLHPQLETCAALAKKQSFLRVHMLSTLYGPDELVDRVIDTVLRHRLSITTSFDAFGPLADELRGATNVADTVMRNMRRLTDANRRSRHPVTTYATITLNRKNLHQLPQILAFIEELGWKAKVDIYRWSSVRHNEVDDLKLEPNNELRAAIELAKSSPVVSLPHWLLDGYIPYMEGRAEKHCPYLDIPSFGSKFFIDPDGEVEVCMGGSVGNILRQTPEEIFTSAEWWHRLREFRNCQGCWNMCYTLPTRVFKDKRPGDLLRMVTKSNNKQNEL